MADNGQVFGVPVPVKIPSAPDLDAVLHPITFIEFGIIGEKIANKKLANVPSAAELIGALESVVFRQGFDANQSKEMLRVSVAEIAVQLCEMKSAASDIGFDEVLNYLASPEGLYEAFMLCMKTKEGKPVSNTTASAVTFFASRTGAEASGVNRWMTISGLREPENPTTSDAGS